MDIVVVSCSHDVENEIAIVEAMLLDGLESFHIRKPHYTTNDYITYISKISPKLRHRVVLHSRHMLSNKYGCKGVHVSRKHRRAGFRTKLRLFKLRFFNKKIHISASLQNLEAIESKIKNYDYIFLSPLYDSMSPDARIKKFNSSKLRKFLRQTRSRVFAHGGISEDKFPQLKKLGFSGVVFQSVIWDSPEPLQQYFKLKESLEEINKKLETEGV